MPHAIRLTLQADGAEMSTTVGPADPLLVLGRGRFGLPRDRNQLHRRHAEVGWERGVPIVRRLGANQVGILRGGARLKVGTGVQRGALEDGDTLFFLLRSDGFEYAIAIIDDATSAAAEPKSAKRSASDEGDVHARPAQLRRTHIEAGGATDEAAWLEAQVAKLSAVPGISNLLPSGVRTNVQQIWTSFEPSELKQGIANFRQQEQTSSGDEKRQFVAMVELLSSCLERRGACATDTCNRGASAAAVSPRRPIGDAQPIFVCATGARGGKPRHAVLAPLGTLFHFEFVGTPNLTSRKTEQKFVQQLVDAVATAVHQHGPGRPVYIVGHSFGSRVAVHLLCREDMQQQLPPDVAGVIAMGYPLVHSSQHRDQKLMELPSNARVLFLSGTADNFMDFALLRDALAASPAAEGLSVHSVPGAGHSMAGVPKSLGGQADADEQMRAAIRTFISTDVPATGSSAASARVAAGGESDDEEDDDELIFKSCERTNSRQRLPSKPAGANSAQMMGWRIDAQGHESRMVVPRPRPPGAPTLILRRMQAGKYPELVRSDLPPPPTITHGASATISLVNRRLRETAAGTGLLGSAAFPEMQMPALGFGCHQLTKSESKVAIPEALRIGYRLIDTAPGYGNRPKGSHRGDNESLVGDAIRNSVRQFALTERYRSCTHRFTVLTQSVSINVLLNGTLVGPLLHRRGCLDHSCSSRRNLTTETMGMTKRLLRCKRVYHD